MRSQRGITLVSLVVTIIILIILAGISINILVGQNGIITRARQAKENMVLAREKEEKQLNELYEQLEGSNQGIPPEEGTIGDLTNKLQDLQNKFDQIQAEYDDFKTVIAEAITENGVETQATDTAEVMAENINKLGNNGTIKVMTSLSYATSSAESHVTVYNVEGCTTLKCTGESYWLGSGTETHTITVTGGGKTLFSGRGLNGKSVAIPEGTTSIQFSLYKGSNTSYGGWLSFTFEIN